MVHHIYVSKREAIEGKRTLKRKGYVGFKIKKVYTGGNSKNGYWWTLRAKKGKK